jgi:hypothetical protein
MSSTVYREAIFLGKAIVITATTLHYIVAYRPLVGQ